MSKGFLGFSNIYLKFGGLLLLASLLMLAWMRFVPGAPEASDTTAYVAAYLFASGLVLYVVGRIAKVVRSCQRA